MPVRNYPTPDKLKQLRKEIAPLGQALETIGCHAIVTDIDGNIIFANQRVEAQTGYPISEVIGKNTGDLWGGLMSDDFYQKMWQTIKVEKNVYHGEIKNKKKDGTEYWQDVIISPVIDDSGEVRYFVAIEPDITKRKEQERIQQEFMSLIAHQLKNPLTVIRWLTEAVIKENHLLPAQQKNIEEIARHDLSLIKLINDFLAVTKGRQNNQPEEGLDLKDQLKSLIDQHLSARPDLKISLFAPGEYIYNTSIKTLVLQVFDNLITNAVHYSDPADRKIVINLGKTPAQYIIRIANNGPLIPQTDHPHIFSKLHRGENALISNPAGSGLGLYLVKMICESNNWDVSFKSPDTDGMTRFTVSIPRV